MMMTKRSHERSLAMLAATAAALAMVEPGPAAGCTMDVECKGVRICQNGSCVYPPPEVTAQDPTPAVPPTRATAAPSGSDAAPVPPAAAVAAPTAAAPAPVASSAFVTAPPSQAPAAAAVDVAASPEGAVPDASPVAARTSWVRWPSQHFLAEVGGFGFRIYDGKTRAFGGGVEAGYRFLHWLAVGAWFEGSGKREQTEVDESPAYRLYDLGLGITVGKIVGPLLADLSVLPELTLVKVESRYLVSGQSATRWGAAADARLRVGLLLGPWCPFIFVSGSYAFREESFTVDHQHVYSGSTTLPHGNASLGLGLAYLFGVVRPPRGNW